jgi:hypothetical protein
MQFPRAHYRTEAKITNFCYRSSSGNPDVYDIAGNKTRVFFAAAVTEYIQATKSILSWRLSATTAAAAAAHLLFELFFPFFLCPSGFWADDGCSKTRSALECNTRVTKNDISLSFFGETIKLLPDAAASSETNVGGICPKK